MLALRKGAEIYYNYDKSKSCNQIESVSSGLGQ
jgi:hypothetical protein